MRPAAPRSRRLPRASSCGTACTPTWRCPETSVWLELTRRCNLTCPHCYIEGGDARGNETPASGVYRLLDEFGPTRDFDVATKAILRSQAAGFLTNIMTNSNRDSIHHLAGLMQWAESHGVSVRSVPFTDGAPVGQLAKDLEPPRERLIPLTFVG